MDKIIIRNINEVPPLSISLQPTLWNQTGSWRYLRPIYSDEKISPCTQNCPINQNIPAWLGLVAEEKFDEALKVLINDNPMPGICGRVCHHPCESLCNRKDYDEVVSINMIERFLGDFGVGSGIAIEQQISKQEKRVAIVGSGPAGLSCAYHLARKGYEVKVFEALSELGGMLRVIPPYRLPQKVLDREISWIEGLGVEFLCNTKIDNELLGRDLSEFNAIFIATGAATEEKLGIPGEDLEGVFSGIEFLRLTNARKKVRIGRKVMVVGGGNTAIDVGRTLRRMGYKPILLYRRTKEQMPAIQEEVEEALREGVRIEYLVSPVRMVGRNGKLAKIECVRNKLISSGGGGRPKPIPIKGSNFFMDADTVILALGAYPDAGFAESQLKKVNGHYITVDGWGWTSCGAIFAGGDVTAGVGTVSGAIGSGKRAALAIDSFLKSRKLPESFNGKQIVEFRDINLDYFSHSKRAKRPQLSIKSRSRPKEVNKGVAVAAAVRESNRCFSCGLCNQCNICLMVCPDVAIFKENESLMINYDYCKGCGICAVECPRSIINLEREELWRK